MDPNPPPDALTVIRLPRTRGDGPSAPTPASTPGRASPHTRGWTPVRADVCTPRGGFPAHAGMDRARRQHPVERRGLPRTRGDGPGSLLSVSASSAASPHTRGWTRNPRPHLRALDGFPAHAGMDPVERPRYCWLARLPRTRGDGPHLQVLGADILRASPHTRGWTPARNTRPSWSRGFPAHAGMDPLLELDRSGERGLPRTRGDGPWYSDDTIKRAMASPHTRGWTR